MESKRNILLQNGTRPETLVGCDLCNVVCGDQESYQRHVTGKNHSAKLLRTSPGGGQNTVKYGCRICDVVCNSNETLNMHLAGRKHIKKLKESTEDCVSSTSSNVDGSKRLGKRAGSNEDLEMANKKVLRSCFRCKAACTSQEVFECCSTCYGCLSDK